MRPVYFRRRTFVLAAIALALAAVFFPLSAVAANNSDVLSILAKVIEGVIAAGRDAYCAAGVQVLCR